jgi:hypothetical protein
VAARASSLFAMTVTMTAAARKALMLPAIASAVKRLTVVTYHSTALLARHDLIQALASLACQTWLPALVVTELLLLLQGDLRPLRVVQAGTATAAVAATLLVQVQLHPLAAVSVLQHKECPSGWM